MSVLSSSHEIPPEVAARVIAAAKAQGFNQSELIAQAVRQASPDQQQEQSGRQDQQQDQQQQHSSQQLQQADPDLQPSHPSQPLYQPIYQPQGPVVHSQTGEPLGGYASDRGTTPIPAPVDAPYQGPQPSDSDLPTLPSARPVGGVLGQLGRGIVSQVEHAAQEMRAQHQHQPEGRVKEITRSQSWPRVEIADVPDTQGENKFIDVAKALDEIYEFGQEAVKRWNPVSQDPQLRPYLEFNIVRHAMQINPAMEARYKSVKALIEQELVKYLGFGTRTEMEGYMHGRTDPTLENMVNALIFFHTPEERHDDIPHLLRVQIYDNMKEIYTALGSSIGEKIKRVPYSSPDDETRRLVNWYEQKILHTPHYGIRDDQDPHVIYDWSRAPHVNVGEDLPAQLRVNGDQVTAVGLVSSEEEHNLLAGRMADIVYSQPHNFGKATWTPTWTPRPISHVIADGGVGVMGVFSKKIRPGTSAYSRIKSPSATRKDAQRNLNEAAGILRGLKIRDTFCVVEAVNPVLAELDRSGSGMYPSTDRAIVAQRRQRMQAYQVDKQGTLSPIFANTELSRDLASGKVTPAQAADVESALAGIISDTDMWDTMLANASLNLQKDEKKEYLIDRLDHMKYPIPVPLPPEQQQQLDALPQEKRQEALEEIRRIQQKERLEAARTLFAALQNKVEQAEASDSSSRLHGKKLPVPPLSHLERDLLIALMDEHMAKMPEYIRSQRQGPKGIDRQVIAAEKEDVIIIAPSEIPPARLQQAIRESRTDTINSADIHIAINALQDEFDLPMQIAAMQLQ